MDIEKDEAAAGANVPAVANPAVGTTDPGTTAAPGPITPAPTTDSYQRLLPTIADLVAQQQYTELARVAELADLNPDSHGRPTRLLLVAPLVLSYLILNTLPPARFALTRLPNRTATHPLAQALFGLVAATSEHSYTAVYSRASAVVAATDDPALAPLVSSLATAFVDQHRRRALELIDKAYTSISVTHAQPYLSLPPDQIAALLASKGWTYDAGSQILTRGPISAIARGKPVPPSLSAIDLIVDAAARLEA
jgi:COP9 signalosome complex subunit 8